MTEKLRAIKKALNITKLDSNPLTYDAKTALEAIEDHLLDIETNYVKIYQPGYYNAVMCGHEIIIEYSSNRWWRFGFEEYFKASDFDSIDPNIIKKLK